MDRYKGATCKQCARHRDECGPLSWRGLCEPCAELNMVDAIRSMREHRGDVFKRWRANMAACVGAELPDN